MKIKLFLFIIILVLPMAGSADYEKNKYCRTYANLSATKDFGQNDAYDNCDVKVETAIDIKRVENKRCKNFYNDENISDDRLNDSEQNAQQMIEQAFLLCQTSQEFWQNGEPDRAIDLLDRAYSVILKIDTHENENLMRQKEDMRFVITKRIYEIYASRKMVINGRRKEIPLTINKKVQHEIDLYTQGELRNHFIASYKRSGKYRQTIVEMLIKEGLPQELSWLPLVESGFIVKALSKQRALGLWQFIPSTGYKFGLSRNQYIDERLNPDKSTRAAISYLKELHSQFGDWSTVLAAYNCGETRVLRVIRNQKIKYLDNFWDLYAQLPEETARYVPKFLATLHIVNNLEKYGMEKIIIDSPIKSEPLKVTRMNHLDDIAKITGIDRKTLEALNPELRQEIVPGDNYVLNIPEGKKQMLLANIDQILRLNPARVDFRSHRVQSGETLTLIARRYSTSVDNIMLANNMDRANHIVTGKMLKIPYKIKTSAQSKMVTLISGDS
ncbi:MAG: transglycosylase SLT domain-containing protein [Desulfobacterales bacterium]